MFCGLNTGGLERKDYLGTANSFASNNIVIATLTGLRAATVQHKRLEITTVMCSAQAPTDLYRLLETPDLHDPPMLVHLEGWVDAGRGGRTAIKHIRAVSEATKIAEFDTEQLLDFRAHRPTLHIVNGISADIDWPVLELQAGKDNNDRDLLVLSGAEPDQRWRTFVAAVVELAQRFNVSRVVCLGAYPAAVPHTRATHLTITSPTPELVRVNQSGATLEVPAGVAAAIEAAASAEGIESLSMWAQVPQYIATATYPPAALALIEGLAEAAGVHLDSGALAEFALTMRDQLDAIIADEPKHAQTVARLEEHHDEFSTDPISGEGAVAISEELGAQFEKFLRAHAAAATEDQDEQHDGDTQ